MRPFVSSAGVASLLFLLATGSSCRDNGPKPTEDRPAPVRASASASESAPPSESASVAANGRSAIRGPRVYISNEDSNNISVIDSATDEVTGTIFVGKRPRGIRLSPDGKTLFVALSGSPKEPPGARDAGRAPPPPDRAADGIALVDVATEKLVRTIPSGQDPECFDFTPDGNLLYVSNEEAAQATIVDIASGRAVKTIALDEEPEGVTMKPAGDVVYVTSEAGNKVFAIDTRDKSVKATIETGPRPRAIVFTPDGARGYITEEQGSSITVVDAKKHKAISHVKLEGTTHKPMGAVVSPDGKMLYVTTGRGGAVVFVDTKSNRVVRIIDHVGVRPWGIGISVDGRKLYTANGPSNDVSVIDVATGTITKKISAGSFPWGVAIEH
jgi:YVTN family beta-propeller protein